MKRMIIISWYIMKVNNKKIAILKGKIAKVVQVAYQNAIQKQ